MSDQIPVAKCILGQQWCNAMDISLGDTLANAKKRGLTTIVAYNMENGKGRLVGVAYRTRASDAGIMLNVCPWCGEPILQEKPAQEAGTGGEQNEA